MNKARDWLRRFGRSERFPDPNVVLAAEAPAVFQDDEGLGQATGIALSDLRPAGIADIDGDRVDVVTEGDYIDAGASIVVVRDEGYRRVVKLGDQ